MRLLALFVVLVTATACHNGSGGGQSTPVSPTAAAPSGPATPSTPTVTTVTVTGNAPNVGATSQYTATAALSDSTTQTVTSQATWASSNASVATVSSAGLVTGVNAGSADISATYQNVTGVSHVTIIRPTFTVSGTVRDGTSNGVLPNIRVSSLDSAGVTKTTTTNGSGGYSIGGVAAGVVEVTFSATGYQSTTRSITVTADTQVNLSLPRVDNSPPPSASVAVFDVDVRTIGNDGPDFCINTPSVGSGGTATYTVTSNSTSVAFTPADPFDWETYDGRLDGVRFAATNSPVEAGPRNGFCAHFVKVTSLSGTFAPDGNSFTATETWSFTLDSGQVKTVTFSWVGTRRSQ